MRHPFKTYSLLFLIIISYTITIKCSFSQSIEKYDWFLNYLTGKVSSYKSLKNINSSVFDFTFHSPCEYENLKDVKKFVTDRNDLLRKFAESRQMYFYARSDEIREMLSNNRNPIVYKEWIVDKCVDLKKAIKISDSNIRDSFSALIDEDQELLNNLEIYWQDYRIILDNFPTRSDLYFLRYGSDEPNKKLFDLIDQKIYSSLKNKIGIVEVVIRDKKYNTDKYGNKSESKEWQIIGFVNAGELKKYVNYNYWKNNGGIRELYESKKGII